MRAASLNQKLQQRKCYHLQLNNRDHCSFMWPDFLMHVILREFPLSWISKCFMGILNSMLGWPICNYGLMKKPTIRDGAWYSRARSLTWFTWRPRLVVLIWEWTHRWSVIQRSGRPHTCIHAHSFKPRKTKTISENVVQPWKHGDINIHWFTKALRWQIPLEEKKPECFITTD